MPLMQCCDIVAYEASVIARTPTRKTPSKSGECQQCLLKRQVSVSSVC